jgi:RNA polymerase sigma-70 factor (ECF subfamily)
VRGQCTGAFWEVEYRQHLVHRAIKLMESDFGAPTVQACLQVVYGRPVAEVARELGLTPGAVCAAKCRVLNRVRQELAGLLD